MRRLLRRCKWIVSIQVGSPGSHRISLGVNVGNQPSSSGWSNRLGLHRLSGQPAQLGPSCHAMRWLLRRCKWIVAIQVGRPGSLRIIQMLVIDQEKFRNLKVAHSL